MGWVFSPFFLLRNNMWTVLDSQLQACYSELLNGFSCKCISLYWRITDVFSVLSFCVIYYFEDVVLALSVSWLEECSSSKDLRNTVRAKNIFYKLIEEGGLSKGSLHILFWVSWAEPCWRHCYKEKISCIIFDVMKLKAYVCTCISVSGLKPQALWTFLQALLLNPLSINLSRAVLIITKFCKLKVIIRERRKEFAKQINLTSWI